MSLKVVRLDPEGHPEKGLEPVQFESPEAVEGEMPTETGYNFFTNAAGNLISGVWQATPYKSRIESYPVDEFMYVISGSVTLTDEEGQSDTIKAGEAFVVPKGWKGTWENTETMRKYYVILE